MSKYKTIFGYTLVPEQEWINIQHCVYQRDLCESCCKQIQQQRDELLGILAHICLKAEETFRKLHLNVPSQK